MKRKGEKPERGDAEKEWYMHVEITVEKVIWKTDKAVQLRVGGRDVWIPLSLTSDEYEIPDIEQAGTIWIEKWRAVEDGLPFVDETQHPLLAKEKHPHIGRKVEHKVFGAGEVREVKADKVVVVFAAPHGQKTLLARFVGLTT